MRLLTELQFCPTSSKQEHGHLTMLLFCFSFLDSINDIVGCQAVAPKGRLTTMFAPCANLSGCRSEATAGVLIQGVVASTRKRWFESRYLQANGEP